MSQIEFELNHHELQVNAGYVTCEYCGETHHLHDVDHTDEGFWCEPCGSDGVEYFNFFEPAKRPQFLLFLETKSQLNDYCDRQSSIKLNKRLSPLRYPGGKSKVADHLSAAMRPKQLDTLISVYAGGASVELAMLQAGLTQQLILNDLDFGLFSLFYMIKQHPNDLIARIRREVLSHDVFFHNRDVIVSGYQHVDVLDAAWAAMIVNRLAYSGIYKANPLGGRMGSVKQLTARFNPDNLAKRIEQIHAISSRITLHNQDGIKFIEDHAGHPRATMFIDPPYYEKGHQLYRHFFTEDQHRQVYGLLESLYEQMPLADMIVTYDDHPFIRDLYARHAKQIELKRSFSA